jgi:hypothetical protein
MHNILDINKKIAFKDLESRDEIDILTNNIDWNNLELFFILLYSNNIDTLVKASI